MTRQVDRSEIADLLTGVFDGKEVGRTVLLEAVADARHEVREALAALPDDRSYTRLRDIWRELPRIPAGT